MQDMSQDRSQASDHDVSDGGTWMTYADLAKLRQITPASAFKLAMRHKWRRQKNNLGQVTVLVPSGWTASQDDADDMSGAARAAFDTALKAIEAAHEAMIERLEAVHGRELAAVEQARDAAQALAQQFAGQITAADEAFKLERARTAAEFADLRRDLDAARERASYSQAALDQAQTEVRKARDAAEALARADADRRAKRLVARLRAAWRGD